MDELAPPVFDREEIAVRRRDLPHWRGGGAVYFVTFRLADSLPLAAQERYAWDLAELRARSVRAETEESRLEAERESVRLYCRILDRALDRGTGECPLRVAENAEILADVLRHDDGSGCDLYAWSIMPNHVHTVVRPRGVSLSRLLQGWKSVSSRRIGRRAGRRGRLWQAESFDHVIRSLGDLHRFCRYTYENSDKAGLEDWPWRWIAPNLPTSD